MRTVEPYLMQHHNIQTSKRLASLGMPGSTYSTYLLTNVTLTRSLLSSGTRVPNASSCEGHSRSVAMEHGNSNSTRIGTVATALEAARHRQGMLDWSKSKSLGAGLI